MSTLKLGNGLQPDRQISNATSKRYWTRRQSAIDLILWFSMFQIILKCFVSMYYIIKTHWRLITCQALSSPGLTRRDSQPCLHFELIIGFSCGLPLQYIPLSSLHTSVLRRGHSIFWSIWPEDLTIPLNVLAWLVQYLYMEIQPWDGSHLFVAQMRFGAKGV